ncbi:MAG: hypothetical protein GWN31_00970 [Candidatus Thorarchaeota archaeon]|nr:hypothetical protein [Candidatus Thorarchaeota archaeon]NIW12517.1 hypothetical protein [Candidatus Thorarchaeota archaeon]NIW50736.1 hypothetical protein [Candidatus Korarchaeota archaeon]
MDAKPIFVILFIAFTLVSLPLITIYPQEEAESVSSVPKKEKKPFPSSKRDPMLLPTPPGNQTGEGRKPPTDGYVVRMSLYGIVLAVAFSLLLLALVFRHLKKKGRLDINGFSFDFFVWHYCKRWHYDKRMGVRTCFY